MPVLSFHVRPLRGPDRGTGPFALWPLKRPSGSHSRKSPVISASRYRPSSSTYSYDQLGRQTGESWLNSSGTSIYNATFTYDSDGELTTAADPYATLTMSYDNDGRLGTLVTSGPGSGQPTVTLTYGYDPSGDVTSIKDSLSGSGEAGQGLTTFAYDQALRLTTITQSFGGTTGPQILESNDGDGLVSELERSIGTTGTSVNTTYAYDADNNLEEIYNSSSSLTPGSDEYVSIQNDYDPAGRVNTMVLNNSGTATTTTYSYDASNQVTGSTGSSNDSYSYDLNGNPDSTGIRPAPATS